MFREVENPDVSSREPFLYLAAAAVLGTLPHSDFRARFNLEIQKQRQSAHLNSPIGWLRPTGRGFVGAPKQHPVRESISFTITSGRVRRRRAERGWHNQKKQRLYDLEPGPLPATTTALGGTGSLTLPIPGR